jgi:hypothetical protein
LLHHWVRENSYLRAWSFLNDQAANMAPTDCISTAARSFERIGRNFQSLRSGTDNLVETQQLHLDAGLISKSAPRSLILFAQ